MGEYGPLQQIDRPWPVYENMPKVGPCTRESSDELILWLKAIHVAHIQAGDEYDVEGWKWFFLWYCSLSDAE